MAAQSQHPYRQIRADFDNDTITVYQAYSRDIADAAVREQKLNASPKFKLGRMTWVKPSWAWMMYRAGYSYKDHDQARILALKMKHEDFLSLLENGTLSTHTSQAQTVSPGSVRIQWDPERTPSLKMLPYRSIQIGIGPSLSETWATKWIVSIDDVTARAQKLKHTLDTDPEMSLHRLIQLGIMPLERPYQVPEQLMKRLEMTPLET